MLTDLTSGSFFCFKRMADIKVKNEIEIADLKIEVANANVTVAELELKVEEAKLLEKYARIESGLAEEKINGHSNCEIELGEYKIAYAKYCIARTNTSLAEAKLARAILESRKLTELLKATQNIIKTSP